jgi:hypothetical protein
MKNQIKKYLKLLLNKRYRRFSSNIYGVMNIFVLLKNLIFASLKSQERILIVYDFSVQPFSIGDFLLLQEVGQVLCLEKNAKYTDLAIILDRDNPKSSDPAFNSIDSGNYLFNFSVIFPLIQFNKFIGSVFVLNSSMELIKFLKKNENYLTVWPSQKDILLTKKYLHYIAFDEVIYHHYLDHEALPSLEPKGYLRDWACNFLHQFCRDKVVVTVNFRNNKAFHTERNLNIEIWRQFFNGFIEREEVIFLLVCARDEIDENLRDCSNIIFTKDYNTAVDQDLALISAAHIHMGASSGPATLAWFSNNKPYFIVRLTMKPDDFETPCLLNLGEGFYRFIFASKLQTFFSGEETLDLLTIKLEEMLCAIDASQLVNKTKGNIVPNWLR